MIAMLCNPISVPDLKPPNSTTSEYPSHLLYGCGSADNGHRINCRSLEITPWRS
jgi:hypothetical protein